MSKHSSVAWQVARAILRKLTSLLFRVRDFCRSDLPARATHWRNFNPSQYRQEISANADFRKFEDGLKMTLDCSVGVRDRIENRLRTAQAEGIVDYGLHAQKEAMITCIVPSVTRADHIHFVDGAAGGYAQAAQMLKQR